MLSWRVRVGALVLAAAASLSAACGVAEGEEGEESSGDAITAAPRELGVEEDIRVLVEHPETLAALEAKGFDLGSRLSGHPFADNRAFAASKEGAAILAAVDEDVAEAKRGDRQLGVGTAFNHRAFDRAWLTKTATHFELVAVANRLDRRHATEGACGEVHLVYRLGYGPADVPARLPMTLMLVYPQARDCTTAARAWSRLTNGGTPAARAAALASGPLADLPRPSKVETNYQLVRWPSTTRKDMGGHAEYALRVFHPTEAGLVPARLENTPRADVPAAAIAAWVKENLADIDRGTAKLPEAMLAEKTISVSPKGLARAQNRPFAVALGKDGADLGDVDLSGLSLVGSRAALVRRLDTMSCAGCHQAQGIAGFQILGHDPVATPVLNTIVEGVSPHTREQLAYRLRDLAALAQGTVAQAPIPFAERSPASGAFTKEGGYGSVCGLGDPGFASWTCGEGFSCSDVNGDQVGICVSDGDARTAGEACEESDVEFATDPHADRVTMGKLHACKNPAGATTRCVRSGGDPGGFPNGMCGGGCSAMGQVEKTGICGVAVPSGFNDCLLQGKPFIQCASGGPKAYRKACSAKDPCGPDYACSGVPGAPKGVGACLPPYFILQARVDGHVLPRE